MTHSAAPLLLAAVFSGCTLWKGSPSMSGNDSGGEVSVEGNDDTAANEAAYDLDGDGWRAENDCDDTDAAVNPGADERCNGIDDDCNGLTDDGVGPQWYVDADGDAYGKVSIGQSCEGSLGAVTIDGDCNDEDATINPDSTIQVDGQDSNCNGKKDWLVTIAAAVDDEGEVCVDSDILGNTGNWHTGAAYEVYLSSGTHTVGIHGWDTGRVITAAIAHIEISDGSVWVTDGTWRYDPDPNQDGIGRVGWCSSGFDDSDWGLALDLGPIGDPSNPWGSAPSLLPESSPAHWIWDHFPVDLNTQYLRFEFVLP